MNNIRYFIDLCEDINDKINALRAKTVANGATEHEEIAAQQKADELEKKQNSSFSSNQKKVSPEDNLFVSLGYRFKNTMGRNSDTFLYVSGSINSFDAVRDKLIDAGYTYKGKNSQGYYVFDNSEHEIRMTLYGTASLLIQDPKNLQIS